MKKLFAASTMFAVFLSCASAQIPEGHYDVLTYSAGASVYEKYLVSVDSYTTNGGVYHKKYTDYLNGIAKILLTEKTMDIAEKSIGFYYDKKENRKDKLFLGVDILIPDVLVAQSETYEKNARILIGSRFKDVMGVLHSCTAVLAENEVKGIVIGLVWQRGGARELINVWVSKEDIALFYKNSLTLSELVVRSTVTNTEGRIIRLTL
jgi:hypothetical protein